MSTITELRSDDTFAADPGDGAVIDLRDGLEPMRGIAAAMALSAPVWIGVAVVARWARQRNAG